MKQRQPEASLQGHLKLAKDVCGDHVVRLCPPLIVNEEEVDTAVRIFGEAFAVVSSDRVEHRTHCRAEDTEDRRLPRL